MGATFKIAMPAVESPQHHSGIGRVISELTESWGSRVEIAEAVFTSTRFPILRGYPQRLAVPGGGIDLVYLPRVGGVTALKRTSLPAVVTVHDVGFWDCAEDAKALGIRQTLIFPHFRSLKYAGKIVVVSQFTRDRLLALLPELDIDKIRVIHLGVSKAFGDWSLSRAASRKAVHAEFPDMVGQPLIIYVGDDAPRKNLPMLLSVFRQVKAYYQKAQLIKVGRAKLARDRDRTLAEMRRLELEPGRDVIFVDEVDDTQLAALYAASDLFVTASQYEGFGLPAVEALAMGTPVVATQCASHVEILGGAAMLAAPNLDSMTSAVLNALTRPPDQPGSHELKQYVRRYSWTAAANQYLEVFTEVAASGVTSVATQGVPW